MNANHASSDTDRPAGSRFGRRRFGLLFTAALLVGAASVTLAVHAQPPGGPPAGGVAGPFATLDTDDDGVVTREEFEAGGDPFALFDHNGDGVLSAEDRLWRHRHAGRREGRRAGAGRFEGPGFPGMPHHRGTLLARAADRAGNGDGTVSADEWRTFVHAADADGDGKVSGLELAQAVRPTLDRPEPAFDVAELEARFDELDSNGDGLLSGDELNSGRPWARHRRPEFER